MYQAEVTARWGGLVSLQHMFEDGEAAAWQEASSVSFWFNNVIRPEQRGRCQLALALADASNCTEDCGDINNDEVYWSFHDVLDDQPGLQHIEIPVQRTTEKVDLIQKFVLMPWYGKKGNAVLDMKDIRGMQLSVRIGEGGTRGDTCRGVFLIDGPTVTCAGGCPGEGG